MQTERQRRLFAHYVRASLPFFLPPPEGRGRPWQHLIKFHPEKLQAGQKLSIENYENKDFNHVLSLYDVSGKGWRLYHDLQGEQLILTAPLCNI